MSIAACQVSTVIIDLHLRLGNLQNCLQLLYIVDRGEGRKKDKINKQKIKNEPRKFMYLEHTNVKFGFVILDTGLKIKGIFLSILHV